MLSKLFSKRSSTLLKLASQRTFASQDDSLVFDFSEKADAKALGLKNPENKENMNFCATITHTLDMAMS